MENLKYIEKGHSGIVYSVAFSPDGRRILSTDASTIRVWDPESEQELFKLKDPKRLDLLSVKFSPNGRRIVSGRERDNTMRIWDAESGDELIPYSNRKKSESKFGHQQYLKPPIKPTFDRNTIQGVASVVAPKSKGGSKTQGKKRKNKRKTKRIINRKKSKKNSKTKK